MDPEAAADQIEDLIRKLPLEEKVPVVALKHLLDEQRELDKQREAEIDAITEKYRKLEEPTIARVSEIIKGSAIKDDELKDSNKYLNSSEVGQLATLAKGSKLKEFWFKAIENSKFSQLITEEDKASLAAIEEIRCEASPATIQVWFTFSDNPNFSACTVHRSMLLSEGHPTETKGDLIQWKQGKCLTFETKTIANKKTGEKKVVLSDKKKPSFFHFFSNHNDQEEDGGEHLQVQAMIFNEIVNEVVPYSLEYYFGLVEGEDEDEDDEDFDGEGEDDEDDEDVDSEDDDEDEPRPAKKQKK